MAWLLTPFTAIASVFSGGPSKKIEYHCPDCNDVVWVYNAFSQYKGERCISCRTNQSDRYHYKCKHCKKNVWIPKQYKSKKDKFCQNCGAGGP
eukprot:UN12676